MTSAHRRLGGWLWLVVASACGGSSRTGDATDASGGASSSGAFTPSASGGSDPASSGAVASSGAASSGGSQGSSGGSSSGVSATDASAPGASAIDAAASNDAGEACPTQSTSSVAQPMPLVSRGVPAFASSTRGANAPSKANSGDNTAYWQSSAQPVSSANPAWVAYDLSSVTPCQRKNVLASWYQPVPYDGFDPYDFTIPTSYVSAADSTGNGQYGLPMDYTLEGNTAPGGGTPPASGWTALLPSPVSGNVYHARVHALDLAGYSWLRMTVTAVTGSASGPETPTAATNLDVAFKLDVQDASLGAADSWLFLGDSITSHCMGDVDGVNADGGAPFLSFPELVHAAAPAFFPGAVNGGMGGAKTITNPAPQVAGDAVNSIDTWLALFPGKFVGLSWGTNDCGGNSWGIDPSIAAYKTLVNKVVAAGKVPVVPHMPWSPSSGVSGATDASSGAPYAPLSPGAAYNAQIDSQIYTIANVVRGPDLWAVFEGKTSLFIASSNLHPNDPGIAVYRQAWATAMLEAVYPH